MTLSVPTYPPSEEEAKQRRPLGARRSHVQPLRPVGRFDGARDGPGTPDGIEVATRSIDRPGETRRGYTHSDERHADAGSDPSSSRERGLVAISPAAETSDRRGPSGSVNRRADTTIADDGTPTGLRLLDTSSCVAQENLSVLRSFAPNSKPENEASPVEFPTFDKVEDTTFGQGSSHQRHVPSLRGHGPETASASSTIHTKISERSIRSLENRQVAPEDVSLEVRRLLKASSALLRAGGRFMEAQNLVDNALLLAPTDPDAVCLSGECFFASGNLEAAYSRLALALELNERHVPALQALGLLYQTRGMLPEAVRMYSLAVEGYALTQETKGIGVFNSSDTGLSATRSRLAATLSDVGTQIKLKGDVVKAMDSYTEAMLVDPSYAPAVYNLGVALHELGQNAAAEQRYLQASALDPAHADALCNLGVTRKLKGDLPGSIAAYEQCLAVNPNHILGQSNIAIALNDLANLMKQNGDVFGAIRVYEKALTFDGNSADILYNLGVANAESGELDRAVVTYETCLKLRPGCAEAWNNLGVLLRERGNTTRAVECYRTACALKPKFAQAFNNLGVLSTVQGHAQEALVALQSAIASDPSYAVAHNNLGVLLRDTGDVYEALHHYKECARLCPDDRNSGQNYLLALNYVYDGRNGAVSDAHLNWGARMAEIAGTPLPRRAFNPLRDVGAGEKLGGLIELSRSRSEQTLSTPTLTTPGNSHDNLAALAGGVPSVSRPLVVGYVSPDMYTHSVSYFALAPLSHHDRHRVKCVVYSATPVEDARTKLLRQRVAAGGGEWRDVAGLSERALGELIQLDGVDILVDLTGHTANNRLATLALRPAPVQVTWMGYPNTTGLGAVDYRITDALCDPVSTRQVFAETNVRLPGCFLSYTPHPEAPPVVQTPCLHQGYVTFGCFNALAKITGSVRVLWGKVMREVPTSRLVIKAKPFACASIQRRFLAAMASEGVASWRIDVRPLVAATDKHLDVYSQVDIGLDTFPYAGTTTTCEALWAGVPVVTLQGASHAHNVGVSLLNSVGLETKCVASSEDAYVSMCIALANDHAGLNLMRKTMRNKMTQKDGLCDGSAFTEKLEDAYVAMWRRYCEGKGGRPLRGGIARE